MNVPCQHRYFKGQCCAELMYHKLLVLALYDRAVSISPSILSRSNQKIDVSEYERRDRDKLFELVYDNE